MPPINMLAMFGTPAAYIFVVVYSALSGGKSLEQRNAEEIITTITSVANATTPEIVSDGVMCAWDGAWNDTAFVMNSLFITLLVTGCVGYVILERSKDVATLSSAVEVEALESEPEAVESTSVMATDSESRAVDSFALAARPAVVCPPARSFTLNELIALAIRVLNSSEFERARAAAEVAVALEPAVVELAPAQLTALEVINIAQKLKELAKYATSSSLEKALLKKATFFERNDFFHDAHIASDKRGELKNNLVATRELLRQLNYGSQGGLGDERTLYTALYCDVIKGIREALSYITHVFTFGLGVEKNVLAEGLCGQSFFFQVALTENEKKQMSEGQEEVNNGLLKLD